MRSHRKSPDDGKAESEGFGSFLVMQQTFRQAVDILSLKIHLEVVGKLMERIGQVHFYRFPLVCPPKKCLQDKAVGLSKFQLKVEISSIVRQIRIGIFVIFHVSPYPGSHLQAESIFFIKNNKNRFDI